MHQHRPSPGRYAVLRLAGQLLLVYPVDRGSDQPNAYVLVESNPEDQEEDRELLGEFARLLSVHWDQVERSTVVYGEWVKKARLSLETHLPGTSQAVHILRDSVGTAARSASPVMLCGPVGVGRIRAVTHYHITADDIDYTLDVCSKVVKA